ncbi:MAG: substrate-binding domain-containing protein, partial [Oscillospiraceae bacterium]|nr:substrate-binding domain-containing protein [Oscillospiraceae bacterium]
MSKLKNYLCGLLAVLLVIGSVACGDADSPTATSEPSAVPSVASSATEPELSPDPEQVDPGEVLVAVLIPGPVGYFQAVRAGMDRAAESYGITLEYLDAGWDAARQLSQIEDSIARGVDIIAVCAVDADAIISGIEMANDAGVPIIAFTNA